MKIGITFDLKSSGAALPGQPDDAQEEFDSPATIEAIAVVLRGLGHEVQLLGDGRELLEKLLAEPPEFVFNFAEGEGIGRAREARVPAVLEMLGIPYSGSDPLTLAATLDKDCAKRLAASAGIPVPADVLVRPDDDLDTVLANAPMPAIVKPAWEGSSKGIRSKSLVERPEDLPEVIHSLWRDHRQPVLVEEFIDGPELTVGILGNQPPQILGVMQVVPLQPTARFVYSLEIKRDYQRLVRYHCPPHLPAAETQAVEKAALLAYRCLDCRDVSRIDFRLRDGVPYFLEVNPLPGLNPEHSDLVIMARTRNWSYERLIGTILQAALDRIACPTPSCHASLQSPGPL